MAIASGSKSTARRKPGIIKPQKGQKGFIMEKTFATRIIESASNGGRFAAEIAAAKCRADLEPLYAEIESAYEIECGENRRAKVRLGELLNRARGCASLRRHRRLELRRWEAKELKMLLRRFPATAVWHAIYVRWCVLPRTERRWTPRPPRKKSAA